MSSVQYFTAVQAMLVAEDGTTTNAVTGTVTFTPNFSEVDSALYDCSILIPAVPAVIHAGVLCTPALVAGVPLVDSIGLGVGDTPLLYKAEYSGMTNGLVVSSFWFPAPGTGASVDLNTVARVPPSGQIIPGQITY